MKIKKRMTDQTGNDSDESDRNLSQLVLQGLSHVNASFGRDT